MAVMVPEAFERPGGLDRKLVESVGIPDEEHLTFAQDPAADRERKLLEDR
jgi:hypothetical protein